MLLSFKKLRLNLPDPIFEEAEISSASAWFLLSHLLEVTCRQELITQLSCKGPRKRSGIALAEIQHIQLY